MKSSNEQHTQKMTEASKKVHDIDTDQKLRLSLLAQVLIR